MEQSGESFEFLSPLISAILSTFPSVPAFHASNSGLAGELTELFPKFSASKTFSHLCSLITLCVHRRLHRLPSVSILREVRSVIVSARIQQWSGGVLSPYSGYDMLR